MSRDPAAKWILENQRPDLIANWFKNRDFDTRQLREKAEATIWSGLDENKKTPVEVLQMLSEARRSAAYLVSLTAHAGESGPAQWSSDPERYRFVSIAVTEADESMSSDLDEIAKLEKLVRTLIESTDRLTTGPA